MDFFRAKIQFEAVLQNWGNKERKSFHAKTHTIFVGQLFAVKDMDELPTSDSIDDTRDDLWEEVQIG